MDAFAPLHPVPAAWLQSSEFARFASAYTRRLPIGGTQNARGVGT